MSHRLVVLVLVLAAATVDAAPKVDRRDIGGLTFTLPAGWKFDMPAGVDHAQMTYADKTRYCIISLYAPITSDNAELDFQREWQAIAGTIKDQKPKPSHRKLGGRNIIEATGTITANDGTAVFERVGVIAGDGQIAAMIVFTSNEKTQRACKADADAMYSSVTFSAPAAAAPAPAAPASPTSGSAPAKPAGNALAGTMKSTITLGDLAGTWTSGASAMMHYYSTSSGDYSGSTVSYVAETFTFRANGTYDYTESGLSNGSRFNDKDSGTLTLSGTNILLKAKNGREQTKQLIAFMDLPDASAIMTLYSVYPGYDPLDATKIANQCYAKDGMFQCTNGEVWSRAAPTAKAKK